VSGFSFSRTVPFGRTSGQLRELNQVATGVVQQRDGRARHVGGRHRERGAASLDSLVVPSDIVDNIGVLTRLPDGRVFSVLGFTVAGGKVVEIDILADPDRISRLDLSALER
jgi:hypothetical protein